MLPSSMLIIILQLDTFEFQKIDLMYVFAKVLKDKFAFICLMQPLKQSYCLIIWINMFYFIVSLYFIASLIGH